MPAIKVREFEGTESFIRRFKRVVERCGILGEVKKRKHYEKPSQVRKRKKQQAIKRRQKKERRDSAGFDAR